MYCKYCGEQIGDNSKYCTYCGNEINNNEDKRTNSLEKEKRIKLIAFIIVGAVVFSLLVKVTSDTSSGDLSNNQEYQAENISQYESVEIPEEKNLEDSEMTVGDNNSFETENTSRIAYTPKYGVIHTVPKGFHRTAMDAEEQDSIGYRNNATDMGIIISECDNEDDFSTAESYYEYMIDGGESTYHWENDTTYIDSGYDLANSDNAYVYYYKRIIKNGSRIDILATYPGWDNTKEKNDLVLETFLDNFKF